ncbi:polycomb group RING finger protein 3 isoform X2 [Ailuropoda melanoleuca]|uniref:polycomb group RING finger protein 3 isoform X2 n=1 Tax=Ailuropoda melanoleuca TaxID=9646 RepID=UPI0014940DE8|nr:polycomb group RING finger protein 3 isoform X2 [Ailuropoda melanoleuca]
MTPGGTAVCHPSGAHLVSPGHSKPKMLTRKIKLWDINAHITCRLCSGYLIDATTVTECLHTFCRSCLVKYLEENNTCPTCRIVIHQSHPLQYIGHDRTMQDIVYKLVPGLQEAEMRKQREFYHKLGMEVPGDIKGETCSAKQHLDPHRNGETKADDSPHKEAAEERQDEDNDYHRSDEQDVISCASGQWITEGTVGNRHPLLDIPGFWAPPRCPVSVCEQAAGPASGARAQDCRRCACRGRPLILHFSFIGF